MLETFMKHLLDAIRRKKIVIIGAGKNGKQLMKRITDEGITVSCFMDNNEKLHGTQIDGITVFSISRLDDVDSVYLISVGEKYRNEIYSQLLKIGIPEEKIIKCYLYREYEYMRNLPEKYYKEEVMEMYREGLHKEMNYDNPQTYNEKISWEKLNVHDPRRTKLADKYLVRDWVEEKIGEEHLTKLYGVWDDARDIDFSLLPNQFVLKTNQGNSNNIIVHDKDKIDEHQIRKQLAYWMAINYAYHALEMHYKDIVPKIFCEEFLEDVEKNLYEYKIYCFHGKPVYVNCLRENTKSTRRSAYYDCDWNKMPFSYGDPFDEDMVARPGKLDEMLELSRILCSDFSHVRVDWYILDDGRIVFGEMTFTPWAGRHPFVPDEWDMIWGKLI